MSIKNYWEKTKELRRSMPKIMTRSIIGELNEEDDRLTMSEAINNGLLKYKEFRILYKKTGIKPCYYAYLVIVILCIIFIGFFEKYLTFFIATIYPLYMSYKTLQYKPGDKKPDNMGVYTNADKQKDVTQWLSYWVVFSFFINFEEIMSLTFKKHIRFYFFIKVIFLLLCLLPQYQLSSWIYNNFIGHLFIKYEDRVYNLSQYILNAVKAEERKRSQSIHKKDDDYQEEETNKNVFSNLVSEAIKKEAENEGNINNEAENANEAENERLDDSAIIEDDDENEGIKED